MAESKTRIVEFIDMIYRQIFSLLEALIFFNVVYIYNDISWISKPYKWRLWQRRTQLSYA